MKYLLKIRDMLVLLRSEGDKGPYTLHLGCGAAEQLIDEITAIEDMLGCMIEDLVSAADSIAEFIDGSEGTLSEGEQPDTENEHVDNKLH